ncbi:hypothetical protein [Phytomonospora endophytica]|uniref:Uncharacterized protein n=1 Tax=Phytomonospora endophytica TaxID=714109 RepID=A0A841FWZ1_9ACTN|nr:hypothetical protein [Phytomonospora endophytica]MBB6037867.1 hypothetical protein [Phytomonospora endophytica]GIG68766.1 hypothetical protein Pen01_50610 [Phytomonospora endophytica]
MTLILSPAAGRDTRVPIERAVVDRVAASRPRETYLVVRFERADGRASVHHAWTDGGEVLGARIDAVATARGMDGLDWLAVTARHEETSVEGRMVVTEYRLRAVLADVEAGRGALPDERRDLTDALAAYCDTTGRAVAIGAWCRVGPAAVDATP